MWVNAMAGCVGKRHADKNISVERVTAMDWCSWPDMTMRCWCRFAFPWTDGARIFHTLPSSLQRLSQYGLHFLARGGVPLAGGGERMFRRDFASNGVGLSLATGDLAATQVSAYSIAVMLILVHSKRLCITGMCMCHCLCVEWMVQCCRLQWRC